MTTRRDHNQFIDKSFDQRADQLDRLLVSELSPITKTALGSPAEFSSTAERSTNETDSNEPPSPLFDPVLTATHSFAINGRKYWFSGTALLCRCPDCQAPMTVRIWLGLADCWRCGCGLQIDEMQLAELRQKSTTSTGQQSAASNIASRPNVPSPAKHSLTGSLNHALSGVPVDVSDGSNWRADELERLTAGSRLAGLVRSMFNSLPAWLVSFLFHLALILILAMIMLQNLDRETLSIVLSTFTDKSRTEGGEIRIENLDDQLADETLPANKMEEDQIEARETKQAIADALELVVDPLLTSPLPDLDEIKRNVTTRAGPRASFAARDPRIRAEIVEKAGGTTLTEAAVARGLRWLASVQNADGSWSLANYDRHARANNSGDAAGTSLALLPFLGAGQTQERGKYKSTVANGLAWLIKHQKSNGDLRADYPGQAGMYAHGQAAIVLSEAFAMTGDEKLRDPAQRAIAFIEKAQHHAGGWRYQPGEAGDTSVFGWQLMALQSARGGRDGLTVSNDALQLADYYLDAASTARSSSRIPPGALYRYRPEEGAFTHTMTAEALLCRLYLGWERDDPRLMTGVRWLLTNHLPSDQDPNIYYWYYGTQLMHHYGGREWEKWNRALRDMLVSQQVKNGKHPGSWNPSSYEWGAQGERIFVTSMAVCTLEVYYRHLPLFEPIVLDD